MVFLLPNVTGPQPRSGWHSRFPCWPFWPVFPTAAEIACAWPCPVWVSAFFSSE
jgi:hypothetical protein